MITRDELNQRYGKTEIDRLEANIKRADPSNTDDVVAVAINDAKDLVESYIGKRYALPLPIIPTSIRRALAVVARYYLYKDKPSEQVQKDYDDVISWLEKLADGKVVLVLGVSAGDELPTTNYQTGAFVV